MRHGNHSRTCGRSIRRACSSSSAASSPSPCGTRAVGSLFLGRDRFGIARCIGARQGDWLFFASEIKGLLASGMVPARPDLRGHRSRLHLFRDAGPDHLFRRRADAAPGHYLQIRPSRCRRRRAKSRNGPTGRWTSPIEGDEERGDDQKTLVDEFEQFLLRRSTSGCGRTCRSALISPAAWTPASSWRWPAHLRRTAIHTYTIRASDQPELDELDAASLVAAPHRRQAAHRAGVPRRRRAQHLSQLITAAEAPVIDTSCAALAATRAAVHACGQKVVLTGEGADEWLVGYPWYKVAKLLGYLDAVPGLPLGDRRAAPILRCNNVPQFPRRFRAAGGNGRGRPECVDRRLRPARPVEAALLWRAHARSAGHDQPWSELGIDLSTAPNAGTR